MLEIKGKGTRLLASIDLDVSLYYASEYSVVVVTLKMGFSNKMREPAILLRKKKVVL